jgi:DNA-binding NarL/FixJ family response regulator
LLFRISNTTISVLIIFYLFHKAELRMVRLVVAISWETECQRIAAMLNAQGDFSVIGTVGDSYRVLHLVETEQPDVVILDYHLGSVKGCDLVPVIKRKAPGVSVIIISSYEDEDHAWDAQRKGASAYLIRKYDSQFLTGIVYLVSQGGQYLSQRILGQVVPKYRYYQKHYRKSSSPKKDGSSGRREKLIALSPTERQIIGYINQGRSTKEIAETLRLKNGTVRNYISIVMRKTGDHNRSQMILSSLGGGFEEGGFAMDNPPSQVYHSSMEAVDENPVRDRSGNPKLQGPGLRLGEENGPGEGPGSGGHDKRKRR